MIPSRRARLASLLLTSLLAIACGDDEQTVEADRVGIGGTCQTDQHCTDRVGNAAEGYDLRCITSFAGGYCGIDRCGSSDDCPSGSGCARHDDGQAYCFRFCEDDAVCNADRTSEVAATCSSNVGFNGPEEAETNPSACIPPTEAR